MTLNYLPEAVPTALGWAHPLTGEQLTAGLPADVGQVASTTITAPGTGYTTATVSFSAPQIASGKAATGTVTVSAGAVTGIVLTSPGYGYTSAPTVTISGPGTGATATATLDVDTIPVAYYKPNAKSTAFLDPEGVTENLIFSVTTGRKVRFAIQSLNNIASVAWNFGDRGVASTTITAPGTGYTAATVAFTAAPAGGVTATGTVQVAAGAVTGITITNPGAGYLVAPTPTISGNGTGATATSTLTAATVTGGDASVHNYAQAGTYDVSAEVAFVGGTPVNATLNIADLVIS